MASSGLFFGVLATLASGLAASPAEEDFLSYVRRFNRPFPHGSQEFEDRRALFDQRVARVRALNDRPDRLWTAGINHLTDRTEAELAQLRGWRGNPLRGNVGEAQPRKGTFLRQSRRATALPRECTNWTQLTATKSVIDQGGCGSCWAVTTATVMRAHAEIYAPKLRRTFSAQELLACVPNPHRCGGDGGCQGATVELALHYIAKHGLATEAQTPYEGVTGQCTKQAAGGSLAEVMDRQDDEGSIDEISQPGVHAALAASPSASFGLRAWERLPENRYEPLLRAVYERGPVAVSVAADGWSYYSSGIFDGCPKDSVIDHAVTLVGFGEGAGSPGGEKKQFWLVQNSWGPGFGEDGMIRLLRRDSDETEQCGVDHDPKVGTACDGGPKQVKVCGMCGILYDTVVPHFAP